MSGWGHFETSWRIVAAAGRTPKADLWPVVGASGLSHIQTYAVQQNTRVTPFP
jgi:hypothetical protein